MHELSIAYSLVELAVEAVEAAGACEVKTVYVRIGALSGVVKEALLFGWDIAGAETVLAGAALLIDEVPVAICCRDCQRQSTMEGSFPFLCPYCGASNVELVQGRELELTSIELIQEEDEVDEHAVA